MGRVVAELHSVIKQYCTGGRRIGIDLSVTELLSVVDAAVAEAGGQPSPAPRGDNARYFFMHGLYEELVQQPSNIYETKRFPDGSLRYIPLSKALWKTCLYELREQLDDGA